VTAVIMVMVLGLAMMAGLTLIAVALNTPRRTLARNALAGFMACTVVWSAISLVSYLSGSDDPTLAIAWTLPVVAIMVSCFRVLIQAIRNAAWRPSWIYIVSLIIHPAVMVILALIPSTHGWLVVMHDDGHAAYGGLFWVHASVSYGLLAGSLVVLIGSRDALPALARRSLPVTITTWYLPVVANVVTIVHDGASGVDLTPAAFTVTALFMGRSMIQDGLADVIPVARVEVFWSLTDAVFVLDTSGRVVDCNRRALRVLDRLGFEGSFHGLRPEQIAGTLVEMLQANGQRDLSIGGEDLVVDVVTSALRDRKGRELGTLVHVRNITEEALRTRELIRVRDALADEARTTERLRAELAEQVVRDVGTGLHNRRYVFEVLPDIVAKCVDDGVPLAVVLIDVDYFKEINDTYGHAAGDRALKAVAQAMDKAAGDAVVARFGGEEFIAIFPSPTREGALERAECIRDACANVEVAAREGAIRITASAGVAWAPVDDIDAAKLIEAADSALYVAKNGGRNQLQLAQV